MITTLDEYIDALTTLRTRIGGDTIILAFDRVITPMVADNLSDGNLDLIHEAIDDAINEAS
jgi:hypothetical protein